MSRKILTIDDAIRRADVWEQEGCVFNFFIRTTKTREILWEEEYAGLRDVRRRLEEVEPKLRKAGRYGLDLDLYIETANGKNFAQDDETWVTWTKPCNSLTMMYRIGGDGRKGVFVAAIHELQIRNETDDRSSGWYDRKSSVELFSPIGDILEATVERERRITKKLYRTLRAIRRLSRSAKSRLSWLPKDIINYVLTPMLMPRPPKTLTPDDHPSFRHHKK